MMMNTKLEHLAQQVWQEYNLNNASYIIKPSCPVLYFGNANEYQESACKIVTVGLNPSGVEFVNGGQTSVDLRFRGSSDTNMEAYCDALNRYFEYNPYRKWFSSYENILQGLDASFWDKGKKNRALHTDICSTLATSPTWSKLKNDEKQSLQEKGKKAWLELIMVLRPDAILIAVHQDILKTLPLRKKGQNISPSSGITQSSILKRADFTDNYSPIVVVGRTRNVPFGSICKDHKMMIGKRILEHFYSTE